ncbi:hypothetical protein F5B22DRAFT_155910 [Xylaria bambusicola]|uniref:uncharacterized protein n=1 Tax=Xylaria bambusicola TaxID=326684 RepID=UPI002008D894|nr:uncharacterized protein F5B22DRAFT_155910 [Xylaria bambusicola]KAI0526384.1 hypothetical protein F5B22DRAFT_155910 [Xylaria bambusicola]
MASSSHDSGVYLEPFFDRCNLPATVKVDCDAFASSRYLGPIQPAPFQGYCSYTLFADEETVVQFRPSAYKLDINMTNTASDVFKTLAPETEYLGQLAGTDLHVFSMRRLPGISLADYRAMSCKRSAREQLVRDFAQLQVLALRNARPAESLQDEKRTVGSSLTLRLVSMSASLPQGFRQTASSILGEISGIEALPWVFTHGDFLAANIMVNACSGELTGLLDWAESEWLPFGVGMYGLEELLGEDDKNGRFVYYPEAGHLRKIFWNHLMLLIPDNVRDSKTVALVKKAQILGVLLWHGIAFDDGKLNRVVEEGKDDREIQRLSVFLSCMSSTRQSKLLEIGSSVTSRLRLIRRHLLRKV